MDASLFSRHPKIATIGVEPLSAYQPSASLILSCFVLLVAVIALTLQRGLLATLYGATYTDLTADSKSERARLSFVYHHIAAVLFSAILACGAYPVFAFVCGNGGLDTPVANGGRVTLGDLLFVLSQLYSAYYLFEVVFRARLISYISLAHHIGLLIVVQTALDLESHTLHDSDSTKEFYFCMVWGKSPRAFDIVTELPLHIILIVWRIKRADPAVCRHIPRFCFVWVCTAAVTETVVTIYMLHQSWDQWHRGWQIITPTVFTLWIVTQFYGALIFLRMARAEGKKAVQAAANLTRV